jgi:serine/threonine-protein kinase RsbW
MTENLDRKTGETLTLQSRISELTLVYSWIERLALKYAIPQNTQFAMNLCLEEVLSNIIRHGYSGVSNYSITVHFESQKGGSFTLTVEDQSPPFSPVDAPELPPIDLHDQVQIGGQGIRLLRAFANTLEYRTTPAGNRLIIGFAASNPLVAPGCTCCPAHSENVL